MQEHILLIHQDTILPLVPVRRSYALQDLNALLALVRQFHVLLEHILQQDKPHAAHAHLDPILERVL